MKHQKRKDEGSDIGTRKLTLTLIKDQTGFNMKVNEYTLPEWRDAILYDNGTTDKADLLWLKGALFGKVKSKRGSYRNNDNVTAITAVMVEHDKGEISFDQAIDILKKAKLRWLAYTSPSYKKVEKEKWRLLLPLSVHVDPERHADLVATVNGLFNGQLADESFTLSQSYYFGPVNSNPDHRCEIGDGDFIDLRPDLYKRRLYKGGTKEAPKPRQRKNKKRLERNIYQNFNRADIDEVRFALSRVNADDYPVWMKVGAALADEYGEEGRWIFHEWSATSIKYQEDFCDEKFDDFAEMTEYTIATVFFLADEADPNWRDAFESKSNDKPNSKKSDINDDDDEDDDEASSEIVAKPFAWRAPALIPRREWLYGNHLIRKFGSATMAAGSVGKSNLTIVEALAMATGRTLLGIKPRKRCRVWMWNGEDPLEEIERRIAAACIHYEIKKEDLEGWLFINSGRDDEIVIAVQDRKGIKIATPMVEAIKRTIIDNGIDVVVIDPFVSSHRVPENDNNAIDLVAKTWTKLADVTNTAVELVHHVRKTGGAEATVDDGRGASSLPNAVRSSRVLNTMSEEEAGKAGVDSRRRYFKISDGRTNLGPPSDEAHWFFMRSINLGNGVSNNPFDDGDNIGVVTAWEWPDPLDGITQTDLKNIAAVIRGGKWRESSQAKDWVGNAIADALGLDVNNRKDKSKITGLLKFLINAKQGLSLQIVEGEDDKRNKRKFVEVRETK